MPYDFIRWCDEQNIPEQERSLLWSVVESSSNLWDLLSAIGQTSGEKIEGDLLYTFTWSKLQDQKHMRTSKWN